MSRLQYLNAWLNGNGAAAINNLMEDAATAEISRSQIWQWIHHGSKLADGRTVTKALYANLRDEELVELGGRSRERYADSVEILDKLILSDEFIEFLTLIAVRLPGLAIPCMNRRVRGFHDRTPHASP